MQRFSGTVREINQWGYIVLTPTDHYGTETKIREIYRRNGARYTGSFTLRPMPHTVYLLDSRRCTAADLIQRDVIADVRLVSYHTSGGRSGVSLQIHSMTCEQKH